MTSITGWLRFVFSVAGMAAFLWLISAAADHVWPEAKWYLIALFVAGWLFVFLRQFVGGISEYREATAAFVHRRIVSADLPPDFRYLSHETTLQQVFDEFGPPSRKLELIASAADDLPRDTKFLAYEYELPYEAAVFVMPEPPGTAESRIRAVYFRSRSNDDELFSPIRG